MITLYIVRYGVRGSVVQVLHAGTMVSVQKVYPVAGAARFEGCAIIHFILKKVVSWHFCLLLHPPLERLLVVESFSQR